MDLIKEHIKLKNSKQKIYQNMFDIEKIKLEENIKSKIYNLIMKEINEKQITYSISSSNYYKLFIQKGIEPKIAVYFVDKLNKDLNDFQLALENETIRLMISELQKYNFIK